MTTPEKDLLTASEGVDEGSAASTAESAGTGEGHGTGTGPAAGGSADTETQPAPPDDVETAASRKAGENDIGQQLEAGEG